MYLNVNSISLFNNKVYLKFAIILNKVELSKKIFRSKCNDNYFRTVFRSTRYTPKKRFYETYSPLIKS